MKTHSLAGTVSLVLVATLGVARADVCPPNASDYETWTWSPGNTTGDDWITADICQSDARKQAARDLVVDELGLADNWTEWQPIINQAANCDPNSWGSRLVNAGFVTDEVGHARDNDSFAHFATPTGILPNGGLVKFWLTQYVSFYTQDEGYDLECLAGGDDPGPPSFTYGSNPSAGANNLHYPWFWNKSAIDRASTLVHEATHEFEGHLDDDECDNGASCDDAFMNGNAQTFQLVFDSQAIDAYQRESGSRELKVVNFGGDTCGYLPFLPDQDRFSLINVMRDKLQKVFRDEPPMNTWPTAAFIDDVTPGGIYDDAAQPDGDPGKAYRIDITNAARWPCDKVCKVSDYVWNANGPDGPRACNEQYQPGNAARNTFNRNRCNELNAQVAAGVTPAEHSSLRAQASTTMQGCIPGVAGSYIAQVCDETIAGAQNVTDIFEDWGIPDNVGYTYDAEESIRACQVQFCGQQDLAAWDLAANEACYEWDDAVGCMDLLCGDLEALAAGPGRESVAYLTALVCRAGELGRGIGLRPSDMGCEAVFNECLIRERYLPFWEDQLVDGECWSAGLPDGDPLYLNRRLALGTLSADRYSASDRGPGLLATSCLAQETECEAFQAMLQALMAKLADLKYEERPVWRGPPLPDPWERFQGRFDRELDQQMRDLGADLLANGPQTMLSRDARVRRAASMPAARVATAELVGRDTYLQAGGARFGEGVFSPETLQRYGVEAQVDPYASPAEALEAELAAMQTLSQRLGSRQWLAQLDQAPRLGGARYYEHLVAILSAPNAVDLLAAHDALAQDIGGLRR